MVNHHLNDSYIASLESAGRKQFSNQGIAFGPYILGFAIEGVCFGMLISHLLEWYNKSRKKDRYQIKLLVVYIALISLAYTITVTIFISWLFAFGYGKYWRFYNFDWITTFFLLVGLTQTPVSFYFVHRAYKLWNNSKTLLIIMSTLLTVSLAACIALKFVAPYIIQVVDFNNVGIGQELHTELLLVVWLATAMLADVLVTVSISWALLRTRLGFQGFERTDRVIKRIIKLTIEAQLIPTVFSAGFLISFAAFPDTNLSAFFLCTPKVYALSLMVVLNSREKIKEEFENHASSPRDRESSYQDREMHGQGQLHTATQLTEIHVHTDIISEVYQLTPLPVKRSINRDPIEVDNRNQTQTHRRDEKERFPLSVNETESNTDQLSFLEALTECSMSPDIPTTSTFTSSISSTSKSRSKSNSKSTFVQSASTLPTGVFRRRSAPNTNFQP